MSGVEFLVQSSIRAPNARRVLYTACAEQDVDLEAGDPIEHLGGAQLYLLPQQTLAAPGATAVSRP
jgi:hypothetical protein